jgi:hypothetical protein
VCGTVTTEVRPVYLGSAVGVPLEKSGRASWGAARSAFLPAPYSAARGGRMSQHVPAEARFLVMSLFGPVAEFERRQGGGIKPPPLALKVIAWSGVLGMCRRVVG